MNKSTGINPSIVYFTLVFAVSWGFILLLAGPENIPFDPEQAEKNLPLFYTLMLLGPGVAGIVLIWLVNGKKGFRVLGSRLLKWRVGFGWYAIALLTAPVLATVALFILSGFNPEYSPGILKSTNNGAVFITGIITGMFVGLFEEVGWSGFIVPHLRKHYSIIVTGIVVGLFWGGWHFILFWENDSFLGTLPALILLGRLFFWLPPFRVFMVWILDRTESLLIVILSHTSLVFTTTVLVPMSLTGKNLLIWLIVWGSVQWLLVLALHAGGMLKERDA